jgi:hypothetical protein
MPWPRGEQHHAAKLSEAEARLALSSRRGEAGQLAKALGVSREQVCRIRRRVKWKCLSEPQTAA